MGGGFARLAHPVIVESDKAMDCKAFRLESVIGDLPVNKGYMIDSVPWGARCYSALAPEALTMGAQFSYSLLVNAENSSTVMGTGSAP